MFNEWRLNKAKLRLIEGIRNIERNGWFAGEDKDQFIVPGWDLTAKKADCLLTSMSVYKPGWSRALDYVAKVLKIPGAMSGKWHVPAIPMFNDSLPRNRDGMGQAIAVLREAIIEVDLDLLELQMRKQKNVTPVAGVARESRSKMTV